MARSLIVGGNLSDNGTSGGLIVGDNSSPTTALSNSPASISSATYGATMVNPRQRVASGARGPVRHIGRTPPPVPLPVARRSSSGIANSLTIGSLSGKRGVRFTRMPKTGGAGIDDHLYAHRRHRQHRVGPIHGTARRLPDGTQRPPRFLKVYKTGSGVPTLTGMNTDNGGTEVNQGQLNINYGTLANSTSSSIGIGKSNSTAAPSSTTPARGGHARDVNNTQAWSGRVQLHRPRTTSIRGPAPSPLSTSVTANVQSGTLIVGGLISDISGTSPLIKAGRRNSAADEHG